MKADRRQIELRLNTGRKIGRKAGAAHGPLSRMTCRDGTARSQPAFPDGLQIGGQRRQRAEIDAAFAGCVEV
jgi:hypothetical protein